MTEQRTAFVTGATGFLGLNLVERLLANGWHVTALHRESSDLSVLSRFQAARVTGDILDQTRLTDIMPENVDAVFHTAANTSVWGRHAGQQAMDNVDGTRNVLNAAIENGARRFIHTSTWNTFDWSDGAISEETSQASVAGHWISYNRTKYAAEQLVKQAVTDGRIEAVILNPAHIVGRYDNHNWARLITMAAKGTLPAVPPGAGCFAHGPAVADAHIAAALKGRNGENYLLGGPEAPFTRIVEEVRQLASQPKTARVAPVFAMKVLAHLKAAVAVITGKEPDITPESVAMVTAHVSIASTRAMDELDYRPTDLQTALQDAYDWLKETGAL